ncbi:MAG: serine/threonine protein kinase, partial [Kofleriaceae bacterium]|nr:serine/threonine protein kinase [Kofleriaceae bacterium]
MRAKEGIGRDPTVLDGRPAGAAATAASTPGRGDDLAAGEAAGEYVIDHRIGGGAMGDVYAGHHPVIGKKVAIKVLKRELAARADGAERFLREARAVNQVDHPAVVDVFALGRLADGRLYLVMDLLAGESLRVRIGDGPLPPAVTLAILRQVAAALDAAHARGVIHRDLKPDNIVVTGPSDRPAAHVLDFGIAKLNRNTPDAAESANLTRTGALLGTPYYMSPEQVFGEKEIDARADVWSVGVILYESLTGVRPVDGDNLGQLFTVIATGTIRPIDEVAPDLPLAVRSLIQEMLRTDRSRRCSSLEPAFEVLRRFT